MAKITIDNITSGYLSTSALNTNFQAIEAELNSKVLYRNNPEGEPNYMENDLDMNSHDILNVKDLHLSGSIIDGGTGKEYATVEYVDTVVPKPYESGKYLTNDGTHTYWRDVDAFPDQTGKDGMYLRTTGTNVYWDYASGGDGAGGDLSNYLVANECIYLNRQVIYEDYVMPSGFNGMSSGPLLINADVTIPAGSYWTILGEGAGATSEMEQKIEYLENKVYVMETLLRSLENKLTNKEKGI